MITKKIFNDLAIFMIGFGVVIGLIFPFFVLVTGAPQSTILTPLFFGMSIFAGILVGLFNIFLSRRIVGSKIKQLSKHMQRVQTRISSQKSSGETDYCIDEDCIITINSEDEIGESAESFNTLVKTLSKEFQSADRVRKFSEMLSSFLELEKLGEESLVHLMEALHSNGGALLLEKEGDLVVLYSSGIKNAEKLLDNPLIWNVLKHSKQQVIEVPEDVMLDGLLVDFRPKTLILEPIVYKDVTLGLIVLASISTYSQDDYKLLNLFSHNMSLAFKNSITYNQLQKLAANDPLTGILNRRFGTQRFKEEFVRSIRYDMPLGVIMFDIDHFKVINDTYGHIVGDKVLHELARTVKLALREGDVFFRYGGEEFIVILSGANLEDVKKTAEQIRHMAEDMEIKHHLQSIKLTISLGGTSYPERDVKDIESLVAFVDARMYDAKSAGRNQSIVE
ncbi:MAG: sensor domain-containing diguanylate cyclase [Firmicutes bacterium]|nr:sensor domain-containing diguanylate cyclase [Bacillota bacterium]